MAFKLNDGQIVLNQVTKQEGKKLPSLRGKIKIFGIAIPVVLWTKTTGEGNKWWSGHIGEESPEFSNNNQQAQQQPSNNAPPQSDDDCPF